MSLWGFEEGGSDSIPPNWDPGGGEGWQGRGFAGRKRTLPEGREPISQQGKRSTVVPFSILRPLPLLTQGRQPTQAPSPFGVPKASLGWGPLKQGGQGCAWVFRGDLSLLSPVWGRGLLVGRGLAGWAELTKHHQGCGCGCVLVTPAS